MRSQIGDVACYSVILFVCVYMLKVSIHAQDAILTLQVNIITNTNELPIFCLFRIPVFFNHLVYAYKDPYTHTDTLF